MKGQPSPAVEDGDTSADVLCGSPAVDGGDTSAEVPCRSPAVDGGDTSAEVLSEHAVNPATARRAAAAHRTLRGIISTCTTPPPTTGFDRRLASEQRIGSSELLAATASQQLLDGIVELTGHEWLLHEPIGAL